MTSRPLAQPRADALATMLNLDLDAGICHACVSFVSLALDQGDPVEIARQMRRMTPQLWDDDGLADPALAAVRRAYESGVPDADSALADLERHSDRSSVLSRATTSMMGPAIRMRSGVACSQSLISAFAVVRARDPDDTALWLYRLAIRQQRRSSGLRRAERRFRPSPGVTALTGIPGISEATAHALIDRFGTIEQLLAAGPERWADVDGVGPIRAHALATALLG